MAAIEYFIKFSRVDPNQPLSRLHENAVVDLDLCKPWYDVVGDCKQQVLNRYDPDIEFTIDFMIPTGNDPTGND